MLPAGEEPRLRILELRAGVGANELGKSVVMVARVVLEGNGPATVDVGFVTRLIQLQCRHAMALVSVPAFEEFTRKDERLVNYAVVPFTFEPYAPIEVAFACGRPRVDDRKVDETFAKVRFDRPKAYDRLVHLGRAGMFKSTALQWDAGLAIQPLKKEPPQISDYIVIVPPDGSKPFAPPSRFGMGD